MSDNKKVMSKLLGDAGVAVLKERSETHGPTEASFTMIAELWSVYLRHARRTRPSDDLQATDVAQMLSMMKKARAMYSDQSNADNYVDDIGYSAIAGMLQLPDLKPDISEDSDAPLKFNLIKESIDGTNKAYGGSVPSEGHSRDR